MMPFILTALWLTSAILLFRSVSIIAGFHKGPLLRRFEKYGDDEIITSLLPEFLLWLGVFLVMSLMWVSAMRGSVLEIHELGIVFMGMGAAGFYLSPLMKKPTFLPMLAPRWYYDLLQRTTRLERRRIAYMWLRLPSGTRRAYNSNHRAFMQWADMIIMATLF